MNFVVKTFDELTKTELYEILKVRSKIFICELKMVCQEIDGMDFSALHFFLEEDGKILAYLRVLFCEENSVKIGRVLSVKHNVGLGANIMKKAMLYIKQNLNANKICLDSQKQASDFYKKLGFKVVSDEFLEEGVLHHKMEYIYD